MSYRTAESNQTRSECQHSLCVLVSNVCFVDISTAAWKVLIQLLQFQKSNRLLQGSLEVLFYYQTIIIYPVTQVPTCEQNFLNPRSSKWRPPPDPSTICYCRRHVHKTFERSRLERDKLRASNTIVVKLGRKKWPELPQAVLDPTTKEESPTACLIYCPHIHYRGNYISCSECR